MGHALATKKPVITEDLGDESTLALNRLKLLEHGFHGGAAVPLLANDRSIGVLSVMDYRIRRFTEDEVALLSAFADQASLALEKTRLLNEAEQEKERSDALYQISNRLAGAHETDEARFWLFDPIAAFLKRAPQSGGGSSTAVRSGGPSQGKSCGLSY